MKRATPGHTLLLGVLLLLGAATQARAQEPFSTVEIHARATQNVRRSLLHQYWNPGRGVALSMDTPFYWGFLEFGGTVHRYSALRDAPGFGALWLYGGWGLEKTWWGFIRVRSSARLGNYRMSFDDAESHFAGTRTESDLALSAGVGLALALAGPVSVQARASHLRVHTSPQLRLWYVSLGVSVRLETGEDLLAFLR